MRVCGGCREPPQNHRSQEISGFPRNAATAANTGPSPDSQALAPCGGCRRKIAGCFPGSRNNAKPKNRFTAGNYMISRTA
jgi:hypothetical protein